MSTYKDNYLFSGIVMRSNKRRPFLLRNWRKIRLLCGILSFSWHSEVGGALGREIECCLFRHNVVVSLNNYYWGWRNFDRQCHFCALHLNVTLINSFGYFCNIYNYLERVSPLLWFPIIRQIYSYVIYMDILQDFNT